MAVGTVFLLPTYLSEPSDVRFLSPMVLDVVHHTDFFLVENVRSARRFVSSLGLNLDISALTFEVVDKHSTPAEVSWLLAPVLEGRNAGVLSEAGLPGLADPGGLVVAEAHRRGVRVTALPGASAIQTALITSGFNGQQFTFHGYLPVEKPARIRVMKHLEQTAQKTRYTQIFMETPFRNDQLLADLLQHLQPHTELHIAADIFGSAELIKAQTIAAWQRQKPALHKIPAVYCIGVSDNSQAIR